EKIRLGRLIDQQTVTPVSSAAILPLRSGARHILAGGVGPLLVAEPARDEQDQHEEQLVEQDRNREDHAVASGLRWYSVLVPHSGHSRKNSLARVLVAGR